MSDDYTPTTEEVCEHYSDLWNYRQDEPSEDDYVLSRVAEFRRWLAEHDRQVAAEAVSAGQAALIDWLIDVGYPFDFTFDSPPHIDGHDLARRWKERDGWDVSDEEAATLIFEERGLVRYARPTALQGVQEESKA